MLPLPTGHRSIAVAAREIGWTLYSRIGKFAEGEGFVSSLSIPYPPPALSIGKEAYR